LVCVFVPFIIVDLSISDIVTLLGKTHVGTIQRRSFVIEKNSFPGNLFSTILKGVGLPIARRDCLTII